MGGDVTKVSRLQFFFSISLWVMGHGEYGHMGIRTCEHIGILWTMKTASNGC